MLRLGLAGPGGIRVAVGLSRRRAIQAAQRVTRTRDTAADSDLHPDFFLQVILINDNVILKPLFRLLLGSYLLRTIHATNRTRH